MPKYKVLRPIEHSLKLYLPEMPDALTTVKSSGNGGDIPVDATGAIELSEKEAGALDLGQVEPLTETPPLEEAKGKKK